MLTVRQAYKAGFLLRCAELGLTNPETEKLAACSLEMRKRANPVGDALAGVGNATLTGVGNAAAALGGLAFKAPLVAALATGGAGIATGILGGRALARVTDPPVDPEAINRNDLIAAYNEYAAEMEERARKRAAGV